MGIQAGASERSCCGHRANEGKGEKRQPIYIQIVRDARYSTDLHCHLVWVAKRYIFAFCIFQWEVTNIRQLLQFAYNNVKR